MKRTTTVSIQYAPLWRLIKLLSLFCIFFLSTSPAVFAKTLKDVRQNQMRLFGVAPLETADAFDVACAAGETDSCAKARELKSGDYFKPKKGFSSLKSACKNGDGPSCMAKGLWEQNGIGTKVGLEAAKKSFSKGCDLGHMPACYMGLKSNHASQSKAALRAAMLELCQKGLDAGCVTQSEYIQKSDLGNKSQALGVISPIVKACEGPASLCNFRPIIGHFSSSSAKPGLDLLTELSDQNSRESIEGELFRRLQAAGRKSKSAPEVIAVIQAFREHGDPIETPRIQKAAASVPTVLAILLEDEVSRETLGDQGRIALLNAAQSGQVNAVNALLAKGVKPNVRNGDALGWTPLQLAAVDNNVAVVEALLKSGADPSFPNNLGDDALIFAAKHGHVDVMQKLLASGANPNRRGDKGETPLFHAIRSGNNSLTEILLDNGADQTIVSANGLTPSVLYADLARQKQEREAALERRRQEKIALERQAQARRHAEARRAAQKKKESSGLFGSLVGVALGAAIGTEMGLNADQAGELAQSFGKIGLAVEKGDAASLQAAKRDVDGLGARLEAVAPPKPVNTYANSSKPSNILLDDRFSPENLAASNLERDRILAERNKANQNALNGIIAERQAPTNSIQRQLKPKNNTIHEQRSLTFNLPTLSNCVTIADPNSPRYGANSCDTVSPQRNAENEYGSINENSRNNSGVNYPGANTITTANNQGTRVFASGQSRDWSNGSSDGRSNSNHSSSSEVSRSNQSQRETGPGYRWIRTQPITVISEHWRSESSTIDLLKTKLENELSRYCSSKYGGANLERSTVRFTSGTLESKRVYDDRINHKGSGTGEGFCRVSRYNGGYDSLSFCPSGPQHKFCPTDTQPSKGIDSEFFIAGVKN